MNSKIELISLITPKNNGDFAIADVNELRGGYILVDTTAEMNLYLTKYQDRLRVGMLCYVKDAPSTDHIYQYNGTSWELWKGQGNNTLATGLRVYVSTYSTLSELDADTDLQRIGELCFVLETDDLRCYNGTNWESFSRIYIQDTAPSDTGGIWIDTSDEHQYTQSNSIVQNLLTAIAILQKKMEVVEYAFNCLIDLGDMENNNYHAFNDSSGVEPNLSGDFDGSDAIDDNALQEADDSTALADADEPIEYKEWVANARHLLIKGGTYAEMIKNLDDFAPRELLYDTTNQALWIKDPVTYKLIKIGSVSSGEITPGDDVDDDTMDGIIQSAKRITGILWTDMVNSKSYLMTIKNGKIDLYDESLDTPTIASSGQTIGSTNSNILYYTTKYVPQPSGATGEPKIYINMFYCGGLDSSDTYNPCDYNFIELSNLGVSDLNLKGLYLHYTDSSVDSNNRTWVTLPLNGVIKSGSTFLIRGAKCGNSTIAKINVGEPDIYWTKTASYNSDGLEVEEETDTDGNVTTEGYSIWDSDGLIKLNRECSLYLSGAEASTDFSTNPLTITQPYYSYKDSDNVLHGEVILYYIDLVGTASSVPYTNTKVSKCNANTLICRYYTMDNVSQATKGISAMKNGTDFIYIDLENTHQDIDLSKYIPKNSTEGKNIFFNKNLLESGAPMFVTCTFGYNAHTTRCFTWVSKGYRDEYLMYKKDGDTEWTTIESFKSGDGRASKNNRNDSIYNRIRSVTSDGAVFTVHKAIIDVEEPTLRLKYVYKVGTDDNWTNEKSFTVRNRQDAIDNGFSFVQVTDLLGFNQEEYETWRLASEYINKTCTGQYKYIQTPTTPSTYVKYESVPNATADSSTYIMVGSYYMKLTTTTSAYIKQDITSLPEGADNTNINSTDALPTEKTTEYITTVDSIVADEPEVIAYYKWTTTTTYSYVTSTDKTLTTTDYTGQQTATADSPDYIFVGKYYSLRYTNIDFTLNTGDATQNGNRINEWIDYFNCGESLFDLFELMYTVGNNDLCPIIPYVLGDGSDSSKNNPINVQYFFTFEHPYGIPRSSSGVYIPCLYSFIYGNTYFLSMNSEITSTAVTGLFNQSSSINIYNETIKDWCDNELTKLDSNIKWKIAFCHEAPFTIITDDLINTHEVLDTNSNVTSVTTGRGGSHLNTVGNYWFSTWMENNGFKLCICGHKHTYSNSRLIHEDSNTMIPIVYDSNVEPSWYTQASNKSKALCTLSTDITLKYVKYVMCLATGYKLTSNKELPASNTNTAKIPWLLEYYQLAGTIKSTKANANLLYPNYIVWNIGQGNEGIERDSTTTESRHRILGSSRKIYHGVDASSSSNWHFTYNVPYTLSDIDELGGNGSEHNSGTNNIIVELSTGTYTDNTSN